MQAEKKLLEAACGFNISDSDMKFLENTANKVLAPLKAFMPAEPFSGHSFPLSELREDEARAGAAPTSFCVGLVIDKKEER